MHARFMDVLDNMQGPRHDGDLRATMMSLYDKALTKPNRIGWLSLARRTNTGSTLRR